MKRACLGAFVFLSFVMGGHASAAELRIIFGKYTPPYVFEDGTGIVVDIVRTALAESGHPIEPVYVPFERASRMLAERQADGTTIVQEGSGPQAAYSQNFIQYHNRAFALRARNLAIGSLADLKDKSVVAFQNADRFLGPEFGQAVAGNPRYKEIAQQEAQTQMLLLGRIDVAVMDESIFRYYRLKLIAEKKADEGQDYVSFEIFPPTLYKAAFIDPKVRDDFDRAIAAMRRDGRYDAVYRKYTERYFPVRE